MLRPLYYPPPHGIQVNIADDLKKVFMGTAVVDMVDVVVLIFGHGDPLVDGVVR